jgi:hypothetical protein
VRRGQAAAPRIEEMNVAEAEIVGQDQVAPARQKSLRGTPAISE